ncbi:hypothetical protein BS47DRAFT_1489458 [Hydnum rufescens UP504]|uniref:Uncharacterized protein n=1 Tax=Hydnum rufescens UP504 TaxID=1448309 RepID=A0A9P6AI25_9AGAM|nr:hypothetical protein BS47DRAFT_1489458 [Hydnum rufescens UP504]
MSICRSISEHNQSDAIVDALTNELSLIQGPVQSYTGDELLRVLVENQVKPILPIAFTNHALDHILRSGLDTGITKKVVRMGSRSADLKISSLSLEELQKLQEWSQFSLAMGKVFSVLKETETEIENLMKKNRRRYIGWTEIKSFIDSEAECSTWTSCGALESRKRDRAVDCQLMGEDEEWTEVQSRPTHNIKSICDRWLAGEGLQFLESPKVMTTTSVEAPRSHCV